MYDLATSPVSVAKFNLDGLGSLCLISIVIAIGFGYGYSQFGMTSKSQSQSGGMILQVQVQLEGYKPRQNVSENIICVRHVKTLLKVVEIDISFLGRGSKKN